MSWRCWFYNPPVAGACGRGTGNLTGLEQVIIRRFRSGSGKEQADENEGARAARPGCKARPGFPSPGGRRPVSAVGWRAPRDWSRDGIGLRRLTLTLPLRGSPLPVGEGRSLHPSLSCDLREVGHGMHRVAQFAEQAQSVEAQRRIVGVDGDVEEEGVDRRA